MSHADSQVSEQPVRTGDVVVTIVELVLLTLGAFVASFFGLFLGMASDGCGGSADCDSDLIGLGVLIAAAAPWVGLIPTGVWAIVRMVRRKVAFWVPLLAIPVWIVLLVLGAWLAFEGAA